MVGMENHGTMGNPDGGDGAAVEDEGDGFADDQTS
jgi:hypothetical protein